MTQLGIAGAQTPKQVTITERLSSARASLRNSHQRLSNAAGRAGLLPPMPPAAEKDAPENSDLNGIVLDIEHLCERLTQDCCEVEKIA